MGPGCWTVELARGLDTLLVAAVVAALAPVLVALLQPAYPQVVVLLAGGVLIGPECSAGPAGRRSTCWPTSRDRLKVRSRAVALSTP